MATQQANFNAAINAIADASGLTLGLAKKAEIVAAYVAQAIDMNIVRACDGVRAPVPEFLPEGTQIDVAALLALPTKDQKLPVGVTVDRAALTDEQKCSVVNYWWGWGVLTVLRTQRNLEDEAEAAANAAAKPSVTL